MNDFDKLTDKQLLEKGKNILERSEEILRILGDLNFVVVGSKNDPQSGLIKAMQRSEENFEKQIAEVRKEFQGLTADVKEIKEDVSDLKTFQSNQKTGFALAKWVLGGGFGLAIIGKLFNDFIK